MVETGYWENVYIFLYLYIYIYIYIKIVTDCKQMDVSHKSIVNQVKSTTYEQKRHVFGRCIYNVQPWSIRHFRLEDKNG